MKSETVLKSDHDNLKKELEELRSQQFNEDQLAEISNKLSKELRESGEAAMMAELILSRAKILDHFTMAYMAELKLKPSEVKLTQGMNSEGYVEMFFEKHSSIIIPGEL